MRQLLQIERQAGRVRDGERWGPRRIDLDLLHVEGVGVQTPGLRLPHPGIAGRSFVLVPLAEIAPELEIPGLGRVDELAGRIERGGLSPWDAV
jgi:2-amino-4-hydroxy-6-hydroxymethyldihydropteridine diphosphokinase